VIGLLLLVTQKYWVPFAVTEILKRDTNTSSTGLQLTDVEKELGVNAYVYRCDDGTEFTASPNRDMSTISIIPASSMDRIPLVTLKEVPSQSGRRYEANGVVLVGLKEDVTLTLGKTTKSCVPIVTEGKSVLNFK
jgi:membrane-bound inhibitor of C-type lysozyme